MRHQRFIVIARAEAVVRQLKRDGKEWKPLHARVVRALKKLAKRSGITIPGI